MEQREPCENLYENVVIVVCERGGCHKRPSERAYHGEDKDVAFENGALLVGGGAD